MWYHYIREQVHVFLFRIFVPSTVIIIRFFGKVKSKREMDVMKKAVKKVVKKVVKILGIVVLALVIVLATFFAYAKYKHWKTLNTPILPDDYYKAYAETFPAGGKLEEYYADHGSYAVEHLEYQSDNKSIGTIRVYYPAELRTSGKQYPVVMVVNGSNTPAKIYLPFFQRLASWGFIVVGTDDPQSGTGETTSIALDFMLNESEIASQIDRDNIGIIGYSQGGAGALGAATKYENSHLYKAIFTGSAAYPLLALNMGWEYDSSQISIPYFMTAATGMSDDSGVADINAEFGGVAPLASLVEIYDSITDDVLKIRARVTGAEHEQMQARTDGYMTAWMLYHLQGDQEAGTVFLGEDAEILSNTNWQDIEKNN